VVREIMVFLHSYGVGTARAVRIYKTYGDDAIGTVRANPYRLAHDIRGIGFKTADEIAERLGIEKNSPLRARAGVAYVLMELTGEGHCAFPEDQLVKKTSELLGIDEGIVRAAIEHEIGEGRLVRDRVGDENWIYLATLYHAETRLSSRIRDLCLGNHPLPGIDIEKALAWVEKKVELQLAPAQRDAISMATVSKMLIITGGPGVGKTTIVDSILRIFSAKRMKCLLCAPTGRAAKRLRSTTAAPGRVRWLSTVCTKYAQFCIFVGRVRIDSDGR
jgi:exodeoxyribonuclease V alpha subunit